jgi:hypothetical protein
MEAFQVAEPSSIIPNGMRISDMTRMFEVEQVDASPEMRWRWALLKMATDTLHVIHHEAKGQSHSIWKEEARLRAAGLLQLALVDSFKAMPSHKGAWDCKWDHRPVSKLALCYRSLQQGTVRGRLDCENILRDAFLGLAAAYQPVVRNLDFQVSLHPISLGSEQRRALVLFTSCIVQGILERISGREGSGQALLALHSNGKSTASLLVQTSDPTAAILTSSGHEIASRLAANLGAEFVCRQGPVSGSILELRFSTDYVKD